MKKSLSTYADRGLEAVKEAIMVKKEDNVVKRARVRLYRASSKPPLVISDGAKSAIGKMKTAFKVANNTFLRVDTRATNIFNERALEVFFDEELAREDMVYLSNKMLFVLDSDSARRLIGSTLGCDKLGFYIDSPYFDDLQDIEVGDMPEC